jgi:hypothetical protein
LQPQIVFDDTLHADVVTTPVPVQDLQFSQALVADERNVVPAIHVGKNVEEEDGRMTDPGLVQFEHAPLQEDVVRPG